MATDEQEILLIHLNDIYDVESHGKREPVGGAARLCTAIHAQSEKDPIVLFSGDCFSPSHLSYYTKGKQMIPVLNSIGTKCAVFGNHDFDFGLDVLASLTKQTDCKWLMSNVTDNETNGPLGNGHITFTIDHRGKKIGLMGLVEKEWLETLATIDQEAVTFKDYVRVGNELAAQLREEGCVLIIAFTHMRLHNDIHLAENVKGIDLILGGHDHIYSVSHHNGVPVVKSGTDFKDFSTITVRFIDTKPEFKIERVSVTSNFVEDPTLKESLRVYIDMMSSGLSEVLGEFLVDLDGTFEAVRTRETNLGNFICDTMVSSCNGDCALLNSGALRSDKVHCRGTFTVGDLMSILPMLETLIVLNVSGATLVDALENGVSKYPSLDGRFPQVSGIRFAFDPFKAPGHRVDPNFVKVGDQYIKPGQYYRLVTEQFVASGREGYDALTRAQIQSDAEDCVDLVVAIRNHLKSVQLVSEEANTGRRLSRHRQSLITASRQDSQLRSGITKDDLKPGQQPSLENLQLLSHHRPSFDKQRIVVEELEKRSCQMAPGTEKRIVIINSEDDRGLLLKEREDWDRSQNAHNEYSGPQTNLTGHSMSILIVVLFIIVGFCGWRSRA